MPTLETLNNMTLDYNDIIDLNLTDMSPELQNYSVNMTLEYSAVKDLSLPDMSPRSWWEYVQRLAKSTDVKCSQV